MGASGAARYRDGRGDPQGPPETPSGGALLLDAARQLLLLPAALLLVAFGVTAATFVPLLADRGQPARPGRKELGTLAREALAKAVLWLTAPLGLGTGRPRRGGGDRRPVLVVADAGHGRHAVSSLATTLRRRGHAWVFAVHAGRGTLRERADQLAQHAEALRRVSGATSIDIVAHGIGGLVAGWYLRHLAPAGGVRRLVSLGTPWHGTRMASFMRGPLAREAQPGSTLLDDLAPDPERLVCIWGTLDPMVLPLNSAIVEGATSVQLSSAGHLDLLFSARAYRAVHDSLDADGGPAVGVRYDPRSEEPS